MGWSCFAKPQGPGAVVRELQRNMNWHSQIAVYRCLRGAFVGLTYYAAVERVMKADGKRCVFAVVTLVRYHPTRWEGGPEMCVKNIDEGMGPFEAQCPQSILDLLTPVEPDSGSYAQEWRDKCALFHARRKMKVDENDVRIWARSHGYSFDTFSDKTKKTWRNAYKKRYTMTGTTPKEAA